MKVVAATASRHLPHINSQWRGSLSSYCYRRSLYPALIFRFVRTDHPCKPISPILPSSAPKVNFSEVNQYHDDWLFRRLVSIINGAALLVQSPSTTSTFFLTSSFPYFLLNGDPQASHYPRQSPKRKFLWENHISSWIQPIIDKPTPIVLFLCYFSIRCCCKCT